MEIGLKTQGKPAIIAELADNLVSADPVFRVGARHAKHGESGLKNAASVLKNLARQTPSEIVEKSVICRARITCGKCVRLGRLDEGGALTASPDRKAQT